MDSSYRRTSLMDTLFVFTVAMFIAAPFAASYPTLVGESPVQEFIGSTGSHPFQESTGRSSSFSGSIAYMYATITLSLSSSDNLKRMDSSSRFDHRVAHMQVKHISAARGVTAGALPISAHYKFDMDLTSFLWNAAGNPLWSSVYCTSSSHLGLQLQPLQVSSSSYLKFQFARHLATFNPSLKHFAAQLWLKY